MMTRLLVTLSFSVVATVAVGAEPPPSESSTDEQLLDKLLGEEAVPAEEKSPDVLEAAPAADTAGGGEDIDLGAVEEIGRHLDEAGRLLSEKQSGEPTQAAQRKAVEELNRLIEAAKRQAAKSKSSRRQQNGGANEEPMNGSSEPEPSPGGNGAEPMGSAGASAGGARPREGKSEESSDRPPGSRPVSDRIGEFRAGLVREAWGHLPARYRDQLLNAGADRVLPQYESAVRRYFESLAQPEGSPVPPSR